MSRYAPAAVMVGAPPMIHGSSLPTIIPPQAMESKRDRKRRETVNKIEMLHDESWKGREEKFLSLYKEFNNENKAVNTQPPTSSKYLLELYPYTVERDALLESADIEFAYKSSQAKRIYEAERETIEAQYWESRDQARQRLLGALEERKRKLREEKDGGEAVSEGILEAQKPPPKKRRNPFRDLRAALSSPSPSTSSRLLPPSGPSSASNSASPPNGEPDGLHPHPQGRVKPSDILLHNSYAPPLAAIRLDDILSTDPAILPIKPAANGAALPVPGQQKRGPRGKQGTGAGAAAADTGADKDLGVLAPGTATALAVAAGQQTVVVAAPKGTRSAAGGQTVWVMGKSLAEMRRMESLGQLEIEADIARIQGNTGRGRRTRGD